MLLMQLASLDPPPLLEFYWRRLCSIWLFWKIVTPRGEPVARPPLKGSASTRSGWKSRWQESFDGNSQGPKQSKRAFRRRCSQ
jgi:hypothetical protein